MIKKIIKKLMESRGLQVVSKNQHLYGEPVEGELDTHFMDMVKGCQPYTMTSLERLFAAHQAAKYIHENMILGDVVECGVWKGGSSMMMMMTLLSLGDTSRNFYLYDTFEGMSEPTDADISLKGEDADIEYTKSQKNDHNEWCYSPIEEVQSNVWSSGYPKQNIKFVKGKVEDTMPETLPEDIAILRLDTDWYESTYHELVHLYPLLTVNGVLIIDDYGHWVGAKKAVDQYFEEQGVKPLLNRIDYTGRMAIKTN